MKKNKQETTKTWDSYGDYLKSKEWKQIKKEYKDLYSTSVCSICSTEGETLNHHHWTYPKDWNDDSPDNLILVCEDCHKNIHEYSVLGGERFTCRNDYLLEILKYYVMIYKQTLKCDAESTINDYEKLIFSHILKGNIKVSTHYKAVKYENETKLVGEMFLDELWLMGCYGNKFARKMKEVLNNG